MSEDAPEIPSEGEAAEAVEAGAEENAEEGRSVGSGALPQGLKPGILGGANGGTEVPPLQSETARAPAATETNANEDETSEEVPVIDVHAPHGGVHTWKDFWIHLGTIAAGLLIAISLEQSVEALHRLHERHQLEADLHTEALRDHSVVGGDLRSFAVERVWLLGLRDEVDRMRASGGKLKLPYPAKPKVDPDTGKALTLIALPSEAVWSTAKESELVVLLRRPVAEMYARHSLQHEFLTLSRSNQRG